MTVEIIKLPWPVRRVRLAYAVSVHLWRHELGFRELRRHRPFYGKSRASQPFYERTSGKRLKGCACKLVLLLLHLLLQLQQLPST